MPTMAEKAPEILIVDDDESTVALIIGALRHAGYNGNLDLVVAGSAEEAENRMRELTSLAGVIVDINLPDEDGQVFVNKARKEGRRFGIALMSGDTIDPGHYRFIQKPIDIGAMLKVVANMLSMWNIRSRTKQILNSTRMLKAELGRAGYGTG